MDEVQGGAPATAPSDYVSKTSFDDFGLSEPVRRAIAERGYEQPTPVQAQTYRPVFAGRDVIVRSKTGTGKTAAFAIPILEKIPEKRRKVSALVMCPTRELALQVADEFTALGKNKDLTVVAVYGGASMGDQLKKLEEGAEIVVGTPGRIFDHIRRKTLRLEDCMVCCLDEADEMLNMGFFEEVTRILSHLPDDCQQLLFSATVPADIEQIIHEYLTDPETILLSGDEYRVDNITNVMYPAVDSYPKPRNLLYMLDREEPEAAIIFCNTRNDTSLVTAVLNRNGYDAELLNGDLPQKERERVMAKVKRGELRFMVATDIAARGIDISDLSHVINYSLPEDPAVFLHRVGRTGRIGKKGTSLSLVSGAEIHTLSALQKKFGIQFEERKLPTPEEARTTRTDRQVALLKDAMSASIFEAYIPLAQELKARPDGEYLLAFALKYFFSHQRVEKVAEREKAELKKVEHERRERGEPKKERRSRGEERHATGEREDRPRREGERAAAKPEREGRRRERREERREREPAIREIPITREDGEQAAAEAAAPKSVRPEPVEGRTDGPSRNGEAQRPPRSRVFVTLGEADGADEAKVREAVATLAPGSDLLGVDVRRSHSFLEVKPEAVEAVVAALHEKEWNGKKLAAEKARRRRR
ncbi:MAG TPA: DEAD/DEAH box helicase [Anaeromyxobacteraceae bacterium]|nr:DEAD/DEAH box helicase [Anaeromyxobacteraceae bacterium]